MNISRKLSFSLPARFRDEASVRAILVTFGAKILSLDCTIKNDQQVFGYCRFNTAQEAAQIGESLNGLRIGDFTVETGFEEETNEDLIEKETPPPAASTGKQVIKEKKPPPRNTTMEEPVTTARKKPGPKPKPKPVVVEEKKRAKVVVDEKPTNVRVKKVIVMSSSSESEDEKGKKLTASKKDVPIPTTHFSHKAKDDTLSSSSAKVSQLAKEEVLQSEEEEMKSVEKSKAQKPGEEEVWEEYLDDRYGVPYYFNPATKETTWELPATASRIVKASPTPATTPSVATTTTSTAATTQTAAVVVEEQQQPIVERQQQHTALVSSSAAAREPQHHQQLSYHQHHQSVMPRAKEQSSSNPPPSLSSSSVPHRIDTKRGASTEVFTGTIANIKQGFGFINCNSSNFTNRADLFFHFDELVEPTSVFFPKKGDEVEFELSFNHNRGQSIAVRVRRPNRGISSSSSAPSHLAPLARSVSHPTSSSALPQSSRHRSRHNISQQRSTSNSRLRSRSPQTSGGGSMNMLRRSVSDGYSGSSHAPSRGWSRDHHQSSSSSSMPPLPQQQQQQQTWVRYTDRKTNLPYWHCPATNETTWTNPE